MTITGIFSCREKVPSNSLFNIFFASTAIAFFLCPTQRAALAEDLNHPRIEVDLGVEAGGDYTFRSEDSAAEVSDVYPTINLGIGLHANQYFSLHGAFVLEPVIDIEPRTHRYFKHLGVYLEEANVQFYSNGFRLTAGKFNPSFGMAWERAPSIYGADFAKDYQLTEQIGLAGEITLQRNPFGKMAFTTAIFFDDTTDLNRSFITKRGHATLFNGGAGNTEKLNNISLTLDGEAFLGMDNLNYHLGYRFRSKGETSQYPHDENGLVAGLYGMLKLDDREIEWIGEFTTINNVSGSSNNAYWFTLGASTQYGVYNVAASYTGRWIDVESGRDLNDTLLSFSAGRELDRGWSADLGYKYERLSYTNNHTIGLRFSKSLEYNSAE